MSGELIDMDELRGLLAAGGEVDLRGRLLRDLDMRGLHLDRVVLGSRGGGRAARLERCQAEGSVWTRCELVSVEIEHCRLQSSSWDRCDLRYAKISDSSFKDSTWEMCDLYRTSFGHDVDFSRAAVARTSLNLTILGGARLYRESVVVPLLQEHPAAMRAFHERLVRRGEAAPEEVWERLDGRHREAARSWRNLSAHWDGLGLHRDASWAYVRAKQNETRDLSPALAWRRTAGQPAGPRLLAVGRDLLRWMGGQAAWLSCGFGESPLRVAVTMLALQAVTALTLLLADVRVAGVAVDSLPAAVLLSLQVLTTSVPDGLELSHAAQWAVALATGAGITLLGLFGFVLGNRIRNA